jgi:branched-chain amino acid transport system ATP-binding protein
MANNELCIERVTRTFGGLAALIDVSFVLAEGEILGVVGPNGAGKTTLFNVITGFLKADQGRITYSGTDLAGRKPHRIVELGITRTFQIAKPFHGMSVYENVLVAALSRRSRKTSAQKMTPEKVAFEALKKVSLTHRKDDSIDALSQGDIRRVELARALATNPTLVLLDESFSGLSLKEMEELAGLIRDLNTEGCSFLIIEHKLKILMSLAPRILVLDFGRMLADGTPKEIADNEQVIQAYLGRRGKALVAV